MNHTLIWGDCIEELRRLPERSIDLVFGSPPYEYARTYGIAFPLRGQGWVDWMVRVYKESLRVCKGLVAYVVEGRTRGYSYSGTPLLLAADLMRAGVTLRKPCIYERDGIPGSGGPDWLKNRYEFIICATNGGRLPWSDNTVMGHPPKFGPGGSPSHQTANGQRVCKDYARSYKPPKLANPGNIIDCGAAGGGNIGSSLAHNNEAPFPEKLAEFFIRSFCPPNGVVCDPFGGSGTTTAVAEKTGRNSISIDIRKDQVSLMELRLAEITHESKRATAIGVG